MKRSRKNVVASGLLALASHATAQVASVCQGDICFKLNIPQNTASSGSGDIFFQIAGPSNYEWIALGQGSSMSGSNMFVVYTSGDGTNVTLSPRTASGYSMPSFNSDAEVTLLEGSGVSNGQMVANVKCSNCHSFSGADFTSNTGDYIYGAHASGGPKNSDDTNARIAQHDAHARFTWNYANAKGGDSVNPLLNAQPSGTSGTGPITSCVPRPANTAQVTTASSAENDDDNTTGRWGPPTWRSEWGPSPTAKPTGRPWGPPDNKKRQEINYCDDASPGQIIPTGGLSGGGGNQKKMLIAHGVLASLAFVIFFPAGSIAVRLASFPGVVWLHAAFQVFAYLVYIAGFGLGVYLANDFNLLDNSHPIIGIVVLVVLFFQPLLGFLHHSLFKKYGTRTMWSYAHIWTGRSAITLGIINGGLGLRLANSMGMSSKSGIIAYGVIAGIVWLAWVASIVVGERRRKATRATHPPKYAESDAVPLEENTPRHDVPTPPNGHYAPK